MPDQDRLKIENGPNDRGSERSLAGTEALPFVPAELRAPIRRRLMDRGVTGEDLDDLCAETLARLIATARRSATEPNLPIEHPQRYALTVADTVFDDHLRRTHPNWYRLKRRILYLLDAAHPRNPFARWRLRLDWLAGFARWSGMPFRRTSRYRHLAHAGAQCPWLLAALDNRSPEQVPLPELLALLFRLIETPLELSELTTLLADLQQIREIASLSLDDPATAATSAHALATRPDAVAEAVVDALAALEFHDRLRQLLCALPVRQRMALLLTLERDELLLLGTVTELAHLLELPPGELSALWPTLPLADLALAERLGLTAKQVANLRKCARERIQRNLTKET
jgi:DNA-directed RNA polymerase specialized sigma24 family protein